MASSLLLTKRLCIKEIMSQNIKKLRQIQEKCQGEYLKGDFSIAYLGLLKDKKVLEFKKKDHSMKFINLGYLQEGESNQRIHKFQDNRVICFVHCIFEKAAFSTSFKGVYNTAL
jgi:hypothetical protein